MQVGATPASRCCLRLRGRMDGLRGAKFCSVSWVCLTEIADGLVGGVGRNLAGLLSRQSLKNLLPKDLEQLGHSN